MEKKFLNIYSLPSSFDGGRKSLDCFFHLNQILLAVRKINQLIVEERDEKRLLEKACKILVETRGYRLAWVCVIKETDKIFCPAASFGPGKDYLKGLKIFLDSSQIAEGPIGKAIKFGRAIICEKIPADKNCRLWKARAEKFGFASSAIAPIIFRKKVFGTINVHSDKKFFFDKEELLLLNEIASDMGLAFKSISDESERKKIEERLLIINKAIESSGEAIWISDVHSRHFYQNKAATKMFGYKSAEEMQAAGGGSAVVKDLRVAKEMYGNITKGKSWSGELEMKTKCGRIFPAFERADAIKDAQGKVIGLIGIVTDITGIKQFERKLEETAAVDEALLRGIADGVVAIDAQSKIIFINKAAKKLLGYTEDEVVGKKWYEIFKKKNELGENIPPANSEFEVILRSGSVAGSVMPNFYEGKNGKIFPVSTSIAPVVIGKKIVGAINVFRDISREVELEKAKTDFLSLASHQLRTPLAATKWTLELFRQGGGFSNKQKSYLDNLCISNDRLISLVSSLLNVARIQTGKLVVRKKIVNISDPIDQVRRACQTNAEKKNQTIKVSMKTKIELTKIDSTLFREALGNIVSNACAYGLKNSKIDISVRENKEFYIVAVHNFGPVIPRREQSRIFTKFYRGKKQINTGAIGSGLGLFLAKSAVENNGGEIWFKSKAGQGTTFFFSVPKYPA